MYPKFYGLRERPFKLTSNPRYLLLTAGHAEALSAVEYALINRIGMVALVGEAGTGKTTVIRAALASLPQDGLFVTINNPTLSRAEFLEHMRTGFGLSDATSGSKTRLLSELEATLHECLRSGRPAGLIVDEAHTAPHEVLEEIRLLANLETDEDKLLPVVLVGQPELADRLNHADLRQLKQRIAVRCSLGTLSLAETVAYINCRIAVAGGDGEALFTHDAVEMIHARSQGVARSISVLCDNALVAGCALGERPIAVGTVIEVCRDLDISPAIDPYWPASLSVRLESVASVAGTPA
jgi:general secretion pathway protein A